MADPLRILYRSLGVPDVLQEENRALSAAAKLLERAEVDNGPAASVVYTSNPRQAMLRVAARVLDSASSALLDGKLDPMLGGFGDGTPATEAEHLVVGLEGGSGILGIQLATALLQGLVEYVNTHPFDG